MTHLFVSRDGAEEERVPACISLGPSPPAGLTWQVIKSDHLVKMLVICSHLREKRAFGDTQHRRLLGDVGLGKEHGGTEPTVQSAQ